MGGEVHATNNKSKFSYIKLANQLPEWKNELPWLGDVPSQALQQALKNLEKAYKNFFAKRTAFPTFKKKGQSDSFRYPQGVKLDQGNSRVFLPKLGWMKYRNSRNVLGEIKNVTVSRTGDKWFVSIRTEREVEQPIPQTTSSVGIDMGVARFATLSNGEYIEPLNSFKTHQQRLARHQRAMSRKVKFSSNRKRQKPRSRRFTVASLTSERISCTRLRVRSAKTTP